MRWSFSRRRKMLGRMHKAIASPGRPLLPFLIVYVSTARVSAAPPPSPLPNAEQVYAPRTTWQETLLATRAALTERGIADSTFAMRVWRLVERDFPVPCDWMQQDAGADCGKWLALNESGETLKKMLARVLEELEPEGGGVREECRGLMQTPGEPDDRKWLNLYVRACELRRSLRLQPVLAKSPRIVFTKHHNMGGSHYAYTEGQSDAQSERHFRPGAALCLLKMTGIYGEVETLLSDPNGIIRDPDVSYDGKRILFAWKKSNLQDDYHLNEMDVATRKVRQITDGLGFADYEGAYLPNGDIVFNSTRCVQTVDCWWTEVSNLYTCDKDGRFLRRLTFDQVHDNFPTVTNDGHVLYTRWEYNDRGQIFPQALFQMHADGTGQTEFYGNNSWFPTTILHARGIPGTDKVIAIATSHHSRQAGKLILINPAKGRQEAAGVQLIAPVRRTEAVRVDAYGQEGDLFQYPYPLSETEYLVTYHPTGWTDPASPSTRLDTLGGIRPRFGIYFMSIEGRRELLASDRELPWNQPVPLTPRRRPRIRPSLVDYSRNKGTYYVQDVYAGPGLSGVARGTVKSLRVVALEYRAAGIGSNGNHGPAGGALVSTPVSIGQGCWDVKVVLGDARVHEDGSAFFQVPARIPVYFQLLDEKGHMVQTMRSWSALQPGENASCAGCHESKNTTPAMGCRSTLALKAGAQPLRPFYGAMRGFSFPREIQPILDRACTRCHQDRTADPPYRRRAPKAIADLRDVRWISRPESEWQYVTERPAAGWIQPGFHSKDWNVGRAGFGTRGTPGGVIHTEWATSDIWLRRDFELPAGTRVALPVFFLSHDEDVRIYLNGVLATSAQGYTTQFITLPISSQAAASLKPGVNLLAVHCHQTTGGQFIDVALADAGPAVPVLPAPPARAFSLLSTENVDPVAKRKWSDAYLALTQAAKVKPDDVWQGNSGDLVRWVDVQSAPPMLPPYSAGSATSGLIAMLESGHNAVHLSREEMDKLACWIDLGVPYCGDYTEANAWSDEEVRKYQHYLEKRKAMEAVAQRNVQELIRRASGKW